MVLIQIFLSCIAFVEEIVKSNIYIVEKTAQSEIRPYYIIPCFRVVFRITLHAVGKGKGTVAEGLARYQPNLTINN